MANEHFIHLLQRYRSGSLTPEERQAFLQALAGSVYEQEMLAWIGEEMNLVQAPVPMPQERADVLFTKIVGQPAAVKVVPLRKWIWAAASILLLCCAGTYWWLGTVGERAPEIQAATDVAPGREGAVLTLSDGSQIVLDSLGNGIISSQGNAQVALDNGQLTYTASGRSTEMVYNIMTVPKGRQFRLVLPDGTKVWLNAASSIRYPASFNGKERHVSITGEAYFEVAKQADMPFRVTARYSTTEVLGTSFNINAYDNEANISTTLLEGSIRTGGMALKPGQQAQQTASGIRIIHHIDQNKIMAWKNGLFNFDGASLHEVMRQLERWYDLKVIYEGTPPEIYFEGEMSRKMSLAEVLYSLQQTGVRFRIEQGKRLVVLKQ